MTAQTETIRVDVPLGDRTYPIHIGRGLDNLFSEFIDAIESARKPVALITDSAVSKAQAAFISKHFAHVPIYRFEAGEKSKNLINLTEALEFLAEKGMDRSLTIFALGGGVVGDFAGFTAASYMRGVDFVQIPTTLLAMVDSSVGGKTGVNLKAGKNLVGAFHQPKAVWIDLDRLQTLDNRQFSAGMAEIIKAGLLADLSLFEQLEQAPKLDADSALLGKIIERACQIKSKVVSDDETESASQGGRALLNLGHTFGHAIEQCTQYVEYLHGEAIAVGMMMAAHLSKSLGYLDNKDVERIARCFEKYDLPTKLKAPLESEAMLTAMGRDKKKQQGKLKYVVLERMGRAKTQSDLEEALIINALIQGGVQ